MQPNTLQINTNFKQIKLTEAEFKNAQNLYNQIKTAPSDMSKFLKMFDIFEPHLNKEVVLKQKEPSKARKIFAVTLFIKFFDFLEKATKKLDPFENYLYSLNKYSNKYKLKEEDKNKKFTFDYNVSSVKEIINYVSDYLKIPKEIVLSLTKNKEALYYLNIPNFKNNINKLKEHFGIDEKELIKILRLNLIPITRSSERIIEDTNYIFNKLNLENDASKALALNPTILSMTKEGLDQRVKELVDFLGVEESKVLSIFPRQSFLLTMPLKHIINNFNSMQNYLGVDKSKMSEIAIMAPVNIRQDFNERISDIENVLKILDVSFDKFVYWSNKTPAMYRITTNYLNLMTDYLSKKIGFTKDEATKYVAKNIHVLGYKINNMEDNTKNIYEVVNKELGIDNESFIEMIKENARILGDRDIVIKDNIKNISENFNVDKETLAKIIKENPYIFTSTYDYIESSVTDTAKFFNIDIEEYKKICIKYPKLMTRGLKYSLANISLAADIRRIDEEKLIKLCQKHPELLARNLSE